MADSPPCRSAAQAAPAGGELGRGPAVGALALLILVWGYNWIIMKTATGYAGPFDFAALRSVLGTVFLFAALLALGRRLKPPPLAPTVLLGLAQTAGFTGLSQWALVAGGAGKTAVLAYTMPFWTLLLAAWLLDERIRGMQWLAVVLALAGLILVLEPWRLQGTLESGLLAVGSGLAWAAGAIVVKRLQARQRTDSLVLTAWQMLFGSLLLVVLALAVPQPPVRWTGAFVALLLYISLVGTAAAWFAWIFVLKRLPAGTASLGILAVPVIGVLASALQLGERPSGPELWGMVSIMGALALLTLHGLSLSARQAGRGPGERKDPPGSPPGQNE
ncbi:MAG: DMT family transporter [Pseudomonadota bacterium]